MGFFSLGRGPASGVKIGTFASQKGLAFAKAPDAVVFEYAMETAASLFARQKILCASHETKYVAQ